MNAPTSGVSLTVRSESIQQCFNSYRRDRYRVNRRYQRKLVWSVEEKQRLIDSIVLALPLPLFLIAEADSKPDSPLELIDGMQRLNAIFSFIEQEFDYNGKYFDLETLADTKALKDAGELKQKTPELDRPFSVAIANYSLALSVFRADDQSDIDEVFRRINSGGRSLSKQALRQAGTISPLADLVRELSSHIRQDTSPSDLVPLRKMPALSISNRSLPYGITVDNVFWVKQSILRREDVRESLDEQVILDILIDCLTDPIPTTSGRTRDSHYNFLPSSASTADTEASIHITTAINTYEASILKDNFVAVYGVIQEALRVSGKEFQKLIGFPTSGRGPRYFHALFITLWELMFKDSPRRVVSDPHALAAKMDGLYRSANIPTGGDWKHDTKRQTIDAFKGIVSSALEVSSETHENLSRYGWTSQLETLMSNALVEQQTFDCKQGFYTLSPQGRNFDEGAFNKVMKTLSAMSNLRPKCTSYVLLGVADDLEDAKKIQDIDRVKYQFHRGFYAVGLDREAVVRGSNLNDYWSWLMQKISSHPALSSDVARRISHEARLIPYHGVAVGVLQVNSGSSPVWYDGNLYDRQGSETVPVLQQNYQEVFARFFEARAQSDSDAS